MRFIILADRPHAIPTVARWYFQEWGREVPGNSFEQTCVRITGKLNRDRLPVHLLAIDDDDGGSVVGVAQLKLREMSIYPDREHWLGGVFVAAPARGRGVASALCCTARDLAASLGVRALHLQTECLDGGLYARLGWRPIEQVRYNGHDVLVMACEIPVARAGGG